MTKRLVIAFISVCAVFSVIARGDLTGSYIQGQGTNVTDFFETTDIDALTNQLKTYESTKGYQYAFVIGQITERADEESEIDVDELREDAQKAMKKAYRELKMGKDDKDEAILIHYTIATIKLKNTDNAVIRIYQNAAFGKGVSTQMKQKVQQEIDLSVPKNFLEGGVIDKTANFEYVRELLTKMQNGAPADHLKIGPVIFHFDSTNVTQTGDNVSIANCSFDLVFDVDGVYSDTITFAGVDLAYREEDGDEGTLYRDATWSKTGLIEQFGTRRVLFFDAGIEGFDLSVDSHNKLAGSVTFSGAITEETKVTSFISVQPTEGNLNVTYTFNPESSESFEGGFSLESTDGLKFNVGPTAEPWGELDISSLNDGVLKGGFASTENMANRTVFRQGDLSASITELDIDIEYNLVTNEFDDRHGIDIEVFKADLKNDGALIVNADLDFNSSGYVTGTLNANSDIEMFRNGDVGVLLADGAVIHFETDLDTAFNVLAEVEGSTESSQATILVKNRNETILTATCTASNNKLTGRLHAPNSLDLLESGRMKLVMDNFDFQFDYHFTNGFEFTSGSGKILVKEGNVEKGFVNLSADAGKAKGTLSVPNPISLFRSGDVKTTLNRLQGTVTYTPSDGFKFLTGSMEVSVHEGDNEYATSSATLDATKGSFSGTLNMSSEQRLFGTTTMETRFQLKSIAYEFVLGDTFALKSGDVTIRMIDIADNDAELLTANLAVSGNLARGSLSTTSDITLYRMADMSIKLENVALEGTYSFTEGFGFNGGSAKVALYDGEILKTGLTVTVDSTHLYGELAVNDPITMYERGDFRVDLTTLLFEFNYDFNNGFELIGESAAGFGAYGKEDGQEVEIFASSCSYDSETKMLSGEIRRDGDLTIEFPMGEFEANLKKINVNFLIDFQQEDFVFTSGRIETEFTGIPGLDGTLFGNYDFHEETGTTVEVGFEGEAKMFGLKIKHANLQVQMDRDFDITRIAGRIGIYSGDDANFIDIENFVLENGTLTQFNGTGQLKVSGFRFEVSRCDFQSQNDNWNLTISAEMEIGMASGSSSGLVGVENFTIDDEGIIAIERLYGDIELPMFAINFNCSYEPGRFTGDFTGTVIKFGVSGLLDIGKGGEGANQFNYAMVKITIEDLGIVIPPTPITIHGFTLKGGYNYTITDRSAANIMDWTGEGQRNTYVFGAGIEFACCTAVNFIAVEGSVFGEVNTSNGDFKLALGLGLDIPASDPYLEVDGSIYYENKNNESYVEMSLTGTLEKKNRRRERLFYAQLSTTLGFYPDYWWIRTSSALEIYKGMLDYNGYVYFQNSYEGDDLQLKIYGNLEVDVDIDESVSVGSVASASVKVKAGGFVRTTDTIRYVNEELTGTIRGEMSINGRIEANVLGSNIDPITINGSCEGVIQFQAGKKMKVDGRVEADIQVPVWGSEHVNEQVSELIDYS